MDFEWRLNGECALWFLVSGDSTIIKDGSSGGATMVAGHPLGAAPPLLYKEEEVTLS